MNNNDKDNSLSYVTKLDTQARQCLQKGDYEKALELADLLKAQRFSSCFEIFALAYSGLDKPDKAIEALEEGTTLAPQSWLNWQLLGNLYSENNRLEDAIKAYERALASPNAMVASIEYNYAIALERHGDYSNSLEHIRVAGKTDIPELRLLSTKLEARLLTALGKFDEAETFIRQAIKLAEQTDDIEALASLLSSHAFITLKGKDDKVAAKKLAIRAFALSRKCAEALWTIREIDKIVSQNAKYFRLLVNGSTVLKKDGISEECGFFTNYFVVADSEREALKLVKAIERKDLTANLAIDESEVLSENTDLHKGVYDATGLCYFQDE